MASDTDDASDSDSELLLHDAARVSPAALRRRLSGRRPSTAAAPRTTTTATTTLLSARHQCSVCAVSPAASPLIPKRGQSLEAACGTQAAQDGGLPRQTSFPPYMRRRDTKSIMASTPPPVLPPKAEHAAGEELPSKDKRFKFVAERSRTVSSVLLALKSSSNFQSQTERVMYGRSQRGLHMRTPVIGGTPVTEEQAVLLRTVVFGDAATPPRSEWSRTGLVMREPERDLGYGLRAPRNGTRGLLAVVQAYLVKHLLFEAPPGMEGAGPPTARPEELLRPSRARQYEALWAVVSAILWKVGEQQHVRVALPQDKSHVSHSPTYFQDGVTEKLHLFEFTTLQDLQIFMKQYLYLFTDDPGPGTLLLLYAAVLTRGCDKVQVDLEDEKACLVTTAEEGPQTIVTLLLVGRATPYLHNGIVYVGDEDHYAMPQYGVLNRSDVGFLVWDDTNDSELQESSRQPGSRLKTPSLPVWVVGCSGHYGVIFNTNRELLRNYHAERRFELLYYTAGAGQWTLTVDTRFNEAGESAPSKSSSSRPKDDFTTTAQALCLEKVIHTKWQDAHVTWNSMIPGV